MSAIAEKQLMFVYNGNEKDADVEFDPEGDFPCPVDGRRSMRFWSPGLVKRRGKQWKVAGTRVQSATSGAKAMQVLRVDLTNRF